MKRFLGEIGYIDNNEYKTKIKKRIFDYGNIKLIGFPKLEDILT